MVTILASHDRIFCLLAPLPYWLLSSMEVTFTVQGSRTACITQSQTNTSRCPVRRFLHHVYVSPWVSTPLMLPSRRSLFASLANDPSMFLTGLYHSRYQDMRCPVRRFLHHVYVSPWVSTPLMLPSRPSLLASLANDPSTFPTGLYHSRYQDMYVPIGAPSL